MSQTEFSLLSEQISGLTKLTNAQFMNVNERLDKINGAVAKHEQQIGEALIERAANREAQKHVIEAHLLTCPQATKIDGLEKKLEDVSFFIRHPKLFIAGIVLIIILSLATFIENNPLKIFVPETPKTEIPK
jgi:hypothetical protein